ncbi:TIGR03032 family protein [Candidatus Kapabacteria bacterium]|nr:TIGR03032 family protein [Candidatus Kapabacteria bacterium]
MESNSPFKLSYTPALAELLNKLNLTVAISTFQAGKLIFISPVDDANLIQLPRTFKKAMGFNIQDDNMILATDNEVVFFKQNTELARNYPKKPNTYDKMFFPRAVYYTGYLDIHDIYKTNDELIAVNTSFSCVCKINEHFNFEPIWKPSWISSLESIDKCHLNGLAMENDQPKYLTALGTGDSQQSWRENITKGGVLIDYDSKEIICDGLAMPHSPRLVDGKVLVLESASGEISLIDPKDGKKELIKKVDYFIRGAAIHDDLLFVATSKLRKNSSTFKHLDIARISDSAGVIVIHLKTGAVMHEMKYETSVDEIYDIHLLPETRRPNILNHYSGDQYKQLITPENTFWAKEK